MDVGLFNAGTIVALADRRAREKRERERERERERAAAITPRERAASFDDLPSSPHPPYASCTLFP